MTHKKKQTMREKRLAIKKLFMNTTFRVGLSVLIGVFGIMYVAQTSSVSTKGYDINDLQRKITNLERENDRLGYQIAQNRSMQSIQARLAGMDLVAADDVEYTTLVGSTVALR